MSAETILCNVQRMPYPAKKPSLLPQILRLNREEGLSIPEAATVVGVHPVTAAKWIKEEKSDYIQRPGRKKDPEALVEISCRQCHAPFQVHRHELGKRVFCSRSCTNEWQRENRGPEERHCPCGKVLTPLPGSQRVSPSRKYCDLECRTKYGLPAHRPKNPENYLTFKCLGCGNEVTRLKKYSTYAKYCSNACAARHTKAKTHIVVDDAVVLDSGYEALLWGMCSVFKVPIERFDREQGVEWGEGRWYAPDFLITCHGRQVAVETKGLEDAEDQERWAAFMDASDVPLLVLDRERLLSLFAGSAREEFLKVIGLA